MTELPPWPSAASWHRSEPAPSEVHHYTSAHGLLAIIESGQLRATEYTGLNDYSEITAGREFALERWLQDRPSLLDELGTDYTEKVGAALRHLEPGRDELDPTRAHVLCASDSPDDANQWRLYGDQGRGFAITLDTTAWLDLAENGRLPQNDALRPTRRVGPWARVIYEEEAWERAYQAIIDSIKTRTQVMRAVGTPHPFELQKLFQDAQKAINTLCALIKTPAFSGERESRIIASVDKRDDRHVNFHANSIGIVRSVNLQSIKAPQLPITSIMIGPGQRYDLAAPTIEALLARHGYNDVTVTRATSSLRTY